MPQIGEAVDWAIDKENDLAAVRVVSGAGSASLPLRRFAPRLGEDNDVVFLVAGGVSVVVKGQEVI